MEEVGADVDAVEGELFGWVLEGEVGEPLTWVG